MPRTTRHYEDDPNMDYYDWEYEDDPPLYADGALETMDEASLQREWERQCNIHDHGIDTRPMGDPVIEDAAARISWVESEQKRRGFKPGPSAKWLEG
jgi:hypothetical protein